MRRITRLSPCERPFRPDARVIDADFVVVRGKRGWFSKLGVALAAAAAATLLGMLTPPLVMAATQMARLL
ncbi:MAG: hypothetical protein AB7P07_14540 [Hyphomonadaceae bacterium]